MSKFLLLIAGVLSITIVTSCQSRNENKVQNQLAANKTEDSNDTSNEDAGPPVHKEAFLSYKYYPEREKAYGVLKNGYSMICYNFIKEGSDGINAYFVDIPKDVPISFTNTRYWSSKVKELSYDIGMDSHDIRLIDDQIKKSGFEYLNDSDELFLNIENYTGGQFAIKVKMEGLGETIVNIYKNQEY